MGVHGQTVDSNGGAEITNGGTGDAHGGTEDANGVTGDAHGVTGDAHGVTGDAHGVTEEVVKIYSCRAEALFDKRWAVNQPNTHLLGRMTNGIIRLDEGWHLDAGWHLDQLIPNPQPAPLWVLPNQKKGTKHMDFIPRKRGDQYLWWKKIRDSIEEEGPKFGLTVAQIDATKALAEGVVASMEATNTAQAALDGARTAEKTTISTNEKALRMNIRIWKATPGFVGSTSEGVLQVVGPESNFDPLTFKSVLKLSIVGGQIRVDFTKEGCDSVAVYCRPRGTAEWTKLGNDSRSPYYDTKPLANPNVPEVREYIGIGVIDDLEIGVPSDIVQITLS